MPTAVRERVNGFYSEGKLYTLSYIKSNSLGVRGRFIRRKTVISIKQYENVFLLLFITPGESIPALYREEKGGGGT